MTSTDRRSSVAPFLGTAARLVLGVVWLWAGSAKLTDADAAVRAVRAYRILPEAFVKPFAWGLPCVEIALGILLILGIASRVAASVSIVIFAVFIAGIVSVWVRGLRIDCGCFGGGGVSASVNGWSYFREIVRDCVLAAIAFFIAIGPDSRFALDNLSGA
jgi:uncharacterized membrane protein YphA (DoxX/SURF4 family)